MIASVPDNGDYTMQKQPPVQIPLSQFNTFCDQYLRPLQQIDLDALMMRTDDCTPYIIPDAGKGYVEEWKTQDERQQFLSSDEKSSSFILNTEDSSGWSVGGNTVIGKEYATIDGAVVDGELNIGRTNEKFLSAFVPGEKRIGSTLLSGSNQLPRNATNLRNVNDFVAHNVRLNAELVHLGLLPPPTDTTLVSEDDEITKLVKSKQEELKLISKVNQKRKARLYQIGESFMGYQEFQSLLYGLDKSIQDAFTRRYVVMLLLMLESTQTKQQIKKETVWWDFCG